MDSNTLAYFMALLSIGLTWISYRSTFFGLKLIAGMWWIGMFIYLQTNPPDDLAEGGGFHTVLLVLCIGFALMIVLSGLGRGISRSRKWNGGEEQVTGGFKWSLPDWLKFNEDTPEKRNKRTNEEIADYRDTLKRALRTGEYSNRNRR
jgi:hypothetical protein